MVEQLKSRESNSVELRIDERDLQGANGAITITVPITISVQLPGSNDTSINVPRALPHVSGRRNKLVSVGELDFAEVSLDPDWSKRKGYDQNFLGKSHTVPMPKLTNQQVKAAAKLNSTSKNKAGYVLDYTHYSVVMNADRRMAFFTAGNIDGKKWFKIKRKEGSGGQDKWYYDPRIDRDAQIGNELYADNDFDRGHLLRREYMTWGSREEALIANMDTFVFPNCSPQHEALNQGREQWLGLEEYILTHAKNEAMKVTVFSGPIFGAKDPEYRGMVRIPLAFWKIAVIKKDDGELSATGYILQQEKLARRIIAAEAEILGDFNSYQVPISYIEEKTRLDFGDLSSFDPLARVEDNELYEDNPFLKGKAISSYEDIVI